MSVAEVKQSVLGMLQRLDEIQLLQVATSLSLTVKETKKNRKQAILNMILRHFSSEEIEDSQDEGLAVFTAMEEELKNLLEDDLDADEKQKLDLLKQALAELNAKDKGASAAQTSSSSTHEQTSGSKTGDVHVAEDLRGSRLDLTRVRMKEFKITQGSVGGEDNCLDYSTVCFQMKEGKELGFSPREIRAGVIRAMKTGTTRRYFEGQADTFTEETFMTMLRELYDRKLSTELVDDMCQCIQKPEQKEKDYVVEMFGLRDNIMKVTKSEEEPLTARYVQKRMMRAISVGLRRATVRVELSSVFKNTSMTDADVLKQVNEVVAWDKENRKKMGDKVEVHALETVEKPKNSNLRGARVRSDSTASTTTTTKEKDNCREDVLVALVQKLETQLETQGNNLQQLQTQMNTYMNAYHSKDRNKGDGNVGGGSNGDGGGGNSGVGGNGGNSGNNKKKHPFFLKCEYCQINGKYCTHCSTCGESGHKRHQCPKNE